jgi:hypothetical protein
MVKDEGVKAGKQQMHLSFTHHLLPKQLQIG